MRGRNVILGIIIGLVIGSGGTLFLLLNMPILGSALGLPINLITSLPENSTNTFSNDESSNDMSFLITNDLKYTIVDVRKSNFGIIGEKPLEGGIFIITKLKIENLGKTEITVYGSPWHIQDSESRIFIPKTFDAEIDTENLFIINIPPGFKITRDIGFEIPENLQLPLQLYVSDRSFEAEPILLDVILIN